MPSAEKQILAEICYVVVFFSSDVKVFPQTATHLQLPSSFCPKGTQTFALNCIHGKYVHVRIHFQCATHSAKINYCR